MDLRKYMPPVGEKPLDNMVDDGGFAAIFRTFACVGDSLSSGEFETVDEKGNKGYHDLFEYSWAQYMARAMGSKCYNFARGGMTAKEFMQSFGEDNGCWDKSKAAQMYVVAMGCNDISRAIEANATLGTMADVKDDWHDNADSFCGWFAAMIARYKEISPDAKFFFLTMPTVGNDERKAYRDRHREIMYEMAAYFGNSYVIDLREYGPVYSDAFKEMFYLHGHLNPMGYQLTAKMVMSYIDYIVRANAKDFAHVGLILTPHKDA